MHLSSKESMTCTIASSIIFMNSKKPCVITPLLSIYYYNQGRVLMSRGKSMATAKLTFIGNLNNLCCKLRNYRSKMAGIRILNSLFLSINLP
jgi:hypothetical protein